MLYAQIKPSPVKTGDKVIDKGFDDVRRALDQLYRVLGVDGETLTIPGNVKCKKLIVDSNSIIIGGTKLSEPNKTQDDYLLYYNHKNKEFRFISQGGASVGTHASSHENGGSDEISLSGLSGTPAALTTHEADTTTHGTTGDIVGTSDSQIITNKKFGGATDYTEFETDGTMKMNGAAIVYDDLQVSISNVRIPISNAPTERLYDHGIAGGVTFPVLGFDVGEYVYFDVQTSHSMKLSTILENHVHFMTPTDGSGTPDRFQFQLDVIVAPINGNWAVPTGSPFTSEHTIASDYTNSHELLDIADIPASNTTVSTIYKCKLTRIAATQDEYSDEVYVHFSDCHYQKDTVGSRTEGSK